MNHWETQAETTMRYHYALIRMTTVERTDNSSAGEDAEEMELSVIAGGSAKQHCHSGKQSGKFFHKVKYALTIQPSNLTFRYLPVKNENFCSHKNLYMSV